MLHETIEHNGHTIEIHTDEDAGDPRKDNDNFGTMVCWHRRYELGDEQPKCDPQAFIEGLGETEHLILPLHLYDHSGISMSVSDWYPYNDPWDAGQVGWIYVSHADIVKEYGSLDLEKARKLLIAEVEEYDMYLRDDVWGYVIDNGESCWGILGYAYCVEEAKRECV